MDSGAVILYVTGLLIAAVCAVAIAQDADKHKVSIDGKPYSLNNGKWAWGLSTFLLLIVTVPYYFSKRSQVVANKPSATPQPSTGRSLASELAELDALKQKGALSPADYERAKEKLLR